MNWLVGLLLGYLLGERKEGASGGGVPVPGGGSVPNPFPFPFPVPPIPGGSTPAPSGTKTPPAKGNTNTGLPTFFPGIIPASFPWGTPDKGTPPDGGGAVPWTMPTTTTPAPVAKTYSIKSGDYPSGLSKKATGDAGRWRELMTVNPEMKTYTDNKNQTQIKPWAVNQKIVVPPGWNL